MSAAKHTPGPWRMYPSIWIGGSTILKEAGIFRVEDVATETVICDRRTPWPERADEMEANARLIAAAPELLAALERIADETAATWVCDVARAAITKATGRATP